MGQRELDKAAVIQAELVRTLLDAEFSVRLSGAYSTLLETRDLIGSLGAVQRQLRMKSVDLPETEFKAQPPPPRGISYAPARPEGNRLPAPPHVHTRYVHSSNSILF